MPDEHDCDLLSDVTNETALTRDADIFGASQNPFVRPADVEYRTEVS